MSQPFILWRGCGESEPCTLTGWGRMPSVRSCSEEESKFPLPVGCLCVILTLAAGSDFSVLQCDPPGSACRHYEGVTVNKTKIPPVCGGEGSRCCDSMPAPPVSLLLAISQVCPRKDSFLWPPCWKDHVSVFSRCGMNFNSVSGLGQG